MMLVYIFVIILLTVKSTGNAHQGHRLIPVCGICEKRSWSGTYVILTHVKSCVVFVYRTSRP